MFGHVDCVKYLVQQSADINIRDDWGKTALEWAKEEGKHDVVNYLSHQK